MKKEIKEALAQLSVLLKNQFTVTGSTALYLHGLIASEQVKDLDILVTSPADYIIELLQTLHRAAPSSTFRENGPTLYSFIFLGAKVDVWSIPCENVQVYTEHGTGVASVEHIIQAKRQINRAKDWLDMKRIAKRIFDQSYFEANIDTLGVGGDYTGGTQPDIAIAPKAAFMPDDYDDDDMEPIRKPMKPKSVHKP